ncbi:uncharacterized protein LOC127079622 [Lathyrus oleraceus]|uniref:uncharacterized protein LOC127079622 n=1 Tax=Pisum sativum TaxID=3888 RepID=UPI0021CF99F8|nr:uncharacterized protein LOC127079622 [Pisum sativum]
MVNRDQDADEVIHRVRRENMMENDLTSMIERIMAQNGLNTGLRQPNYSSPLPEYILQTELPRGCKIPKFTKFSEDTSESTIEHIARYMTEAGDLANSENLRMKYFPSSLTKNTFTWFTTLPPNSIDAWPQLERLFYEQLYMGQTKISLKELANIKRKFTEPINDYLNRFRLLKSRCFTIVPEHELVEMGAGGLDYSIRKRDLIQNAIRDGRLKFANKGKNQMKVDTDPLNIAETNYVEPVEINMVDVREVEAVKETGTGSYTLDGKQATDGLSNDVSFGTSVKGKQVANVEPRTTEGLKG